MPDLEFGATPPLGYRWGTSAAYDAWRAGSARLAVAQVNAAVAGARSHSQDAPSLAILQGFATRYNKPHIHKGRVEVFARGCFARSLVAPAPAVRLLIAHNDSDLLG